MIFTQAPSLYLIGYIVPHQVHCMREPDILIGPGRGILKTRKDFRLQCPDPSGIFNNEDDRMFQWIWSFLIFTPGPLQHGARHTRIRVPLRAYRTCKTLHKPNGKFTLWCRVCQISQISPVRCNRCVAACCSVIQCAAVCCSVFQFVAV